MVCPNGCVHMVIVDMYGIDDKGNYFNVPIMIDEKDVTVFGDDIDLLPDQINDFWK